MKRLQKPLLLARRFRPLNRQRGLAPFWLATHHPSRRFSAGLYARTTALSGSAAHHSLRDILSVSPEVTDALAGNKPVVALESTIYTHGALGVDLRLESIVRENGAVPAVIGILDGVPTVGLTPDEVQRMIDEGAKKVSRRDLAYLVGMGMTGRGIHGGTTVAGTMILARLAGIRVFGTGGLGGVHRGWQNHMDISADLTELGRTRVAVVSSGCKGFLDIPATLEYLETQGVLVSTFADGRSSPISFPAFWARESGVKSPSVVQDERQAAAVILAQERLAVESGLLFANPIPTEHAIPREDMEVAIDQAVREAATQGFSGNENTPFILKRIRELTQERSVPANIALVQANVARAAGIARELSQLIASESAEEKVRFYPTPSIKTPSSLDTKVTKETPSRADILVAGSVAVDLSCDYDGDSRKGVTPQLHTSNPASIRQSVGGVGHNVALAAHRISRSTSKVRLCSLVGDDIAGATVLSALESSGLDTSGIRQLGNEYHSPRTAQYVAVNESDKHLLVAMADMGIFTSHSFPAYWNSAVAAAKPKWLVVDGNWSEADIRTWIYAARKSGAKIAFEPVSTVKSMRLFSPAREHLGLGVFPSAMVDIATPNQYELAAMHSAAKENGYLDSPEWFTVLDAFSLTGARDRFVKLASAEMADAGIPVRMMQLLPYIPTIITKMGDKGALLATILARDDPRLYDRQAEAFLLTRSLGDDPHVGGVYMRYFPAVEKVKDVVSVNGVGDTFLGALVAGLAQGGKVEDLVNVAQKASVLTLRSHQAVSEDLGSLEEELSMAAKRD